MAIGDVPLTPIIDPVTGAVTEIGRIYLRTLSTAVGALAPVDATYWLSQSAAGLTAEVNLGALPTGYLKIASAVGHATPATVASIPQSDVAGLTAALAGKATLPIAQSDVTGLPAALAGKASTSHHATHEPGGADAIVNAAWLNQANLFTVAAQTIQAAAPFLALSDTAQGVDAHAFRMINTTATLRFVAVNDAQTINQATPLILDRAGNVYVGLALTVAGGQIAFPAVQNQHSGANVLDDYEEGTWTPTLGGTATYSAQSGIYTKIGRHVHAAGTLTVTAIGTGATNSLAGLPFPITFTNTPGTIGYFTGSAVAVVWPSIIGSGSSLFLYGLTAAGTGVGPLAMFGSGTTMYFSIDYETAT